MNSSLRIAPFPLPMSKDWGDTSKNEAMRIMRKTFEAICGFLPGFDRTEQSSF